MTSVVVAAVSCDLQDSVLSLQLSAPGSLVEQESAGASLASILWLFNASCVAVSALKNCLAVTPRSERIAKICVNSSALNLSLPRSRSTGWFSQNWLLTWNVDD